MIMLSVRAPSFAHQKAFGVSLPSHLQINDSTIERILCVMAMGSRLAWPLSIDRRTLLRIASLLKDSLQLAVVYFR